jgi:hypothetical protein
MHCTDDLTHLVNVRLLPRPIPIKGIGDKPCFLTHVGDLMWMPAGMRQTFYGAGFGAKLIALNYMCVAGRTLYYNDPKQHSMVIIVDGRHFVTCRQSSNNLLPFPAVGRGTFFPFPSVAPSVPAASFCLGPGAFAAAPVAFAAAPAPLAIRHWTKEQLQRCGLVETLLDIYCRPADDVLATSLTVGALGVVSTMLTPTDVHLNRLLRGPDPNRLLGRVRDPPAGPSRSLPSRLPCFSLVIDQHKSKFPDIFGNTFTLHIACEFSGAFWVEPSKSGSAINIKVALLKFIHIQCNAYGHRVHTIHADADSVFNAMVGPFGAIGVQVLLAPPGHHALRVERYTQTFNERRRMLEASLLFKVPEEMGLSAFLDKHVASSMRNLVNVVSSPSTPAEIVTRVRNPISPIA